MSERTQVCQAAYKKGALAAKSGKKIVNNPYGETKKELQMWWAAGFNDLKAGHIKLDSDGNWEVEPDL